MARRTGEIEEFEFKAIGENHNQGVSFDFILLIIYCLCFTFALYHPNDVFYSLIDVISD